MDTIHFPMRYINTLIGFLNIIIMLYTYTICHIYFLNLYFVLYIIISHNYVFTFLAHISNEILFSHVLVIGIFVCFLHILGPIIQY